MITLIQNPPFQINPAGGLHDLQNTDEQTNSSLATRVCHVTKEIFLSIGYGFSKTISECYINGFWSIPSDCRVFIRLLQDLDITASDNGCIGIVASLALPIFTWLGIFVLLTYEAYKFTLKPAISLLPNIYTTYLRRQNPGSYYHNVSTGLARKVEETIDPKITTEHIKRTNRELFTNKELDKDISIDVLQDLFGLFKYKELEYEYDKDGNRKLKKLESPHESYLPVDDGNQPLNRETTTELLQKFYTNLRDRNHFMLVPTNPPEKKRFFDLMNYQVKNYLVTLIEELNDFLAKNYAELGLTEPISFPLKGIDPDYQSKFNEFKDEFAKIAENFSNVDESIQKKYRPIILEITTLLNNCIITANHCAHRYEGFALSLPGGANADHANLPLEERLINLFAKKRHELLIQLVNRWITEYSDHKRRTNPSASLQYSNFSNEMVSLVDNPYLLTSEPLQRIFSKFSLGELITVNDAITVVDELQALHDKFHARESFLRECFEELSLDGKPDDLDGKEDFERRKTQIKYTIRRLVQSDFFSEVPKSDEIKNLVNTFNQDIPLASIPLTLEDFLKLPIQTALLPLLLKENPISKETIERIKKTIYAPIFPYGESTVEGPVFAKKFGPPLGIIGSDSVSTTTGSSLLNKNGDLYLNRPREVLEAFFELYNPTLITETMREALKDENWDACFSSWLKEEGKNSTWNKETFAAKAQALINQAPQENDPLPEDNPTKNAVDKFFTLVDTLQKQGEIALQNDTITFPNRTESKEDEEVVISRPLTASNLGDIIQEVHSFPEAKAYIETTGLSEIAAKQKTRAEKNRVQRILSEDYYQAEILNSLKAKLSGGDSTEARNSLESKLALWEKSKSFTQAFQEQKLQSLNQRIVLEGLNDDTLEEKIKAHVENQRAEAFFAALMPEDLRQAALIQNIQEQLKKDNICPIPEEDLQTYMKSSDEDLEDATEAFDATECVKKHIFKNKKESFLLRSEEGRELLEKYFVPNESNLNKLVNDIQEKLQEKQIPLSDKQQLRKLLKINNINEAINYLERQIRIEGIVNRIQQKLTDLDKRILDEDQLGRLRKSLINLQFEDARQLLEDHIDPNNYWFSQPGLQLIYSLLPQSSFQWPDDDEVEQIFAELIEYIYEHLPEDRNELITYDRLRDDILPFKYPDHLIRWFLVRHGILNPEALSSPLED